MQGSSASALEPLTRASADLVAGFVLIGASQQSPVAQAIASDGRSWPVPLDDQEDTVLTILSLFWPPEGS
jgi:hypothetical protein